METSDFQKPLYNTPPPGWSEEKLDGLCPKPPARLYLNGLLRGFSPKIIAADFERREATIREALSRTVYKRIKAEIEVETVVWHEVARLLAEAGYYHQPGTAVESLLASISETDSDYNSIELICSIEKNILNTIDFGVDCKTPESDIESFIRQADLLVEEKKYLTALSLYVMVAKICPLDFPGVLVKIAQTYSAMKCYKDSVPMAYFSLQYVKTDEFRSKLYHVLAVAFDELSRVNPTPISILQTLSFYTQSSNYCKKPNEVYKWNKFDFLQYFVELKDSYRHQYGEAAKIALIDFENSITNPKSNFLTCYHAQDIVADMQNVLRRGVKDESVAERLSDLLHEYGHLA